MDGRWMMETVLLVALPMMALILSISVVLAMCDRKHGLILVAA